ncbi:GIDE domain-containing protein [Halobacteriales archaeon Cl-PHB]
MVLAWVFLGSLVVAGLAILSLGLASLRQWYALRQSEPTAAFRATDGPVEVAGTAEPLDAYGTVRSPLTGEACLLYEYDVERLEQTQHGNHWETVTAASDGVTFALGDDTASVLVDPDGATTVLRREYDYRLEPEDEPTDEVSSFLDRSDVDRDSWTLDVGITELEFGDDHRFRERRIHVGEEVYVAGVADRDLGDYETAFGGPDAVIRATRSRGRFRKYLNHPFVISDYPESMAEWWLLKRSVKLLAIGMVPFLLGTLILVSMVSA